MLSPLQRPTFWVSPFHMALSCWPVPSFSPWQYAHILGHLRRQSDKWISTSHYITTQRCYSKGHLFESANVIGVMVSVNGVALPRVVTFFPAKEHHRRSWHTGPVWGPGSPTCELWDFSQVMLISLSFNFLFSKVRKWLFQPSQVGTGEYVNVKVCNCWALGKYFHKYYAWTSIVRTRGGGG